MKSSQYTPRICRLIIHRHMRAMLVFWSSLRPFFSSMICDDLHRHLFPNDREKHCSPMNMIPESTCFRDAGNGVAGCSSGRIDLPTQKGHDHHQQLRRHLPGHDILIHVGALCCIILDPVHRFQRASAGPVHVPSSLGPHV